MGTFTKGMSIGIFICFTAFNSFQCNKILEYLAFDGFLNFACRSVGLEVLSKQYLKLNEISFKIV